MHWAEQRAIFRHREHSLGLSSIAGISWSGSRGMKWAHLKHTLQYMALHKPSPKAIVIHLGSNDLGTVKSVDLRHAMKDDIFSLFKTFPNTTLIVSALLPRIVWDRTSIPVDKLEKKRKQLNRFLKRMVEHDNGIFVKHEDITADTVGLYFRDGVHLSDIGNDLLLLGFRDALETVFSG